jgi:hypothetical protein
MYRVSNCLNVAKYIESLTWDSYGSMWLLLVIQGVSKRDFKWYSKCCCVASVMKTCELKDVRIIHRSRCCTISSLYTFNCKRFRNTRHTVTFGISLYSFFKHHVFIRCRVSIGARGSVVGWGTMLQARRSPHCHLWADCLEKYPRVYTKTFYINPNETQESLELWTSFDPRTHEDSSPKWGVLNARNKLIHLINRPELQ